MDRLTEEVFTFNGTSCMQIKDCKNDLCEETCKKQDGKTGCENCPIQKAIEKLAKYEDLEEQGKLLKLPCAVGDTVWCIEKEERKMCKCIVKSIEVSGFHSFALIEKDIMHGESIGYIRVPLGNFGKTVFLTKTEAEEALKKMNEREGEN